MIFAIENKFFSQYDIGIYKVGIKGKQTYMWNDKQERIVVIVFYVWEFTLKSAFVF